jgi:hypothetical protein
MGYVAGDYSVSGPRFAFYGHGNKFTQGHFPHALRLNTERKIGRWAASTTRQQIDIILCRANFGSKKRPVFAFKVLFQKHGHMLIFMIISCQEEIYLND